MGSLGEIIAAEHFSPRMSRLELSSTLSHMLHDGSGRFVKGADLCINGLRLDVKTYDCDPRKKFFAVNAAKHRQLKGECEGYFWLIAKKYGSLGLVIDYTHYSEISSWECKPLGKYGDPSYNCLTENFIRLYSSSNLYHRVKGAKTIARQDIANAIASNSVRKTFIANFPVAEKLIPEIAS